MIKSIRDHKIVFFSLLIACNVGLYGTAELTLPNLHQHLLQAVQFVEQNAGKPCTIHIAPETTWFSSLSGGIGRSWSKFSSHFTLKNIVVTGVSAALSMGCISSFMCCFVIYKAYRLLENKQAWSNWCSDEELLSDYEMMYRRFQAYNKRHTITEGGRCSLQHEKEIIATYIYLDKLLRTHGLRRCFPHADKRMKQRVQQAHKKLQKVEGFLSGTASIC